MREGEALRVLHRLGELHRLLLPAGQVRGRLGSHSRAMAEASPSTQASCPLRQTLAPTGLPVSLEPVQVNRLSEVP